MQEKENGTRIKKRKVFISYPRHVRIEEVFRGLWDFFSYCWIVFCSSCWWLGEIKYDFEKWEFILKRKPTPKKLEVVGCSFFHIVKYWLCLYSYRELSLSSQPLPPIFIGHTNRENEDLWLSSIYWVMGRIWKFHTQQPSRFWENEKNFKTLPKAWKNENCSI